MNKKIEIKTYGDYNDILPLLSTVVIYRYSDKMLKPMPKKSIKNIKKTFIIQQKEGYNLLEMKIIYLRIVQLLTQQLQIEGMKI